VPADRDPCSASKENLTRWRFPHTVLPLLEVSVCALFNFMNRIVEGSGIKVNPLAASPDEMQARLARMGGSTADPHVGEPSYTRLAALWGIEDLS
jgi:hypothetical protein